MDTEEDPGVFMTKVYRLYNELEYMGDTMSGEGITEVVLERLPYEYEISKPNAERDLDFSLYEIEVTMRNMHPNRVARARISSGTKGCESPMTAVQVPGFKGSCFH